MAAALTLLIGDYIDKTGAMVIQPTFYWARAFSEGVAIVEQLVDGAEKYGYIDTAGKPITGCVYESASSFMNGLGLVDQLVNGAHHWACLDATGKVVWQSN